MKLTSSRQKNDETWKVTMASTNKIISGETIHFFGIKDGLITDEWSKGWE